MNPQIIALPINMHTFNRWAADRGLIRRGTFDEGFSLHILLCSTFGKSALQPFRLFSSPRKRAANLYAYSDLAASELIEIANTVALPDCLSVLDICKLRGRPMRTEFATGQRLGFDIRVRPIRRLSSSRATGRECNLRKGSEVDAFTMERQQLSGYHGVTSQARSIARRELVYSQWLAERFADAAMINPAGCKLVAFRRTRTTRGDGPGPEGPDATIQGELTVDDPKAFANRLRTGIGRHRAYGYGMLLLRPPSRRQA